MEWLETWRPYLYYPLGLLPSVFFTARFFIQWISSEKAHQSVVPSIFWRLSLTGNVLLFLHYCIQLQYPFALIQATNAVISWRNLNLIQTKHAPASTKTIIYLLITSFIATTSIFYLQNNQMEWIRIPLDANWNSSHASLWHLFGFLGASLFASRFWVQWWEIEKTQKSGLSKVFWWLSILGSIMSIIYFANIKDLVSVLPYCFGMIPYVRNLMLLRKNQQPQVR